MIRNVVLGRLNEGVAPADLEKGLQALRELRVAGVEFDLVAGADLGLRTGNADFVITVDLPDEDAYRVYDGDQEHNRIRHEVFAPLCARLERAQIRLPDAADTR